MEAAANLGPKTKTVDSYFGTKQITRDEFIEKWRSHFSDCFSLTETVAEFDEMQTMRQRICELAGKRWDRLK